MILLPLMITVLWYRSCLSDAFFINCEDDLEFMRKLVRHYTR